MLKYLIILSAISVYCCKCDYYDFKSKEVKCDLKVANMEKKNICKPRDTTFLVKDLIKEQHKDVPDTTISKIKSYTIILPRCLGNCEDRATSCMPTHTKTMQREVYIGEVDKTYRLELIKHTKCTCGCDVMASSCNKDQMYDKKLCSCKCDPAKKCEKNMALDAETCTCYCAMKNECSDGYEFYKEECSCGKKNDHGYIELMGNEITPKE